MLQRSYYSASIKDFCEETSDAILGILTKQDAFDALVSSQRDAWLVEIHFLQKALKHFSGVIHFEYSIPRMGRRIDVLLVIGTVIFVIEFKVGESNLTRSAYEQVFDYALDLKNFHKTSHDQYIAPIVIPTQSNVTEAVIAATPNNDKLFFPIHTSIAHFEVVVKEVLAFCDGQPIKYEKWANGRYSPTPTIIEAAIALYAGHDVMEISRHGADEINLSETSEAVSAIINAAQEKKQKAICFVTGVPGAGKTLVGLNIATKFRNEKTEMHSVFLSGNGPLVKVLQEALTRDYLRRKKLANTREMKDGNPRSVVKAFIQNVHHFRDECLIDNGRPPSEHVVLFDEAQRAWDLQQTSNFMAQKKGRIDFNQSEPEFLISCMDRHLDWAVIICLVGGGQEIHTGEAGIKEWVLALKKKYPHWGIHISPQLKDSEFQAESVLEALHGNDNVVFNKNLHLAVSMRSFRAEKVSLLVKQMLDLDISGAKKTLAELTRYPIVITRDLGRAKAWMKTHARGSERYGIVVSSQAERLKPHAIDVRYQVNPIHWFLNDRDDVRSSFYLEDVATEFIVQGLELDWACVVWDADFRFDGKSWEHWSFSGSKWRHILKEARQNYQKNAYRVLLTRARQGMVIVVPSGDPDDPTRDPSFYDSTFKYLMNLGFQIL